MCRLWAALVPRGKIVSGSGAPKDNDVAPILDYSFRLYFKCTKIMLCGGELVCRDSRSWT